MKTEMLGWVGTALVIVAYVPQIRHLYVEKCAWGISISTWLLWLAAGALLLSYCLLRNDTLFTFVQVINITAIVATIILARRSNRFCPYHLRTKLAALDRERQRVELLKRRYVANTGKHR
jgi:hypothetical protein